MKSLCFLLIALLISFSSFSQISVKKVTSPIAVDGILDESVWDISIQFSTNTSSDNTAKFGVLWDDNYLYIGVSVTDNSLCNNKRQGFYDDGIEVCIDALNNKSTSLDDNDRVFIKPVKSYWIQEKERRYTDVIHKYMKTTEGYSMEFAIPWSNLNITPSANDNIGFNLVVNDDDSPAMTTTYTKTLSWIPNTSFYKNPSTWGTITLSNETVSYSGKSVFLLYPNGFDFLINQKETNIEWLSNGIENVNLEYSTDNGINWKIIVNNLPASNSSYTWKVSADVSEQCLIRISESSNNSINDVSKNTFIISKVLEGVKPLISNTWKNYMWPYNAYFPLASNGINGHVGNACGGSSLARILHYWEFPIKGNGTLNFIDNAGNHWSADFENTIYNYDNMPSYLTSDSEESEYKDIARLMNDTSTSMHDVRGTGGDLSNMSYAMNHYFKYKVSTPKIRTDLSKSEWMKLIINELDSGRVILIDGMTSEFMGAWHRSNGTSGHWFHIDGYNEDGKFHGILGFSNKDGYYDIDSLFNYSLNNGILIGLEPDLNGKEIKLTSCNVYETFYKGQIININWQSENIDNIRIEYTSDNGQNWSSIIDNISASAKTFAWNPPNINSSEYKVKITDVADINIYDKSNSTFTVANPEIILLLPKGGEYFIQSETSKICWTFSLIDNIKIEFSDDNGSSWTDVISSTPANTNCFNWNVPAIKSTLCKIRISDASNNGLNDETENTFSIGESNNAGGPYQTDSNTLVLLHFNNNLQNSSTYSDDGVLHGADISYSSSVNSTLGKCLKLGNKSFISIPHNESLNLTDDWTIELWIYFNSFSGDYLNPTFVSKADNSGANYFLWYHNNWKSIKGQYHYNGGDVYSSTAYDKITTGKWYHVKYTRDNTNYVNKVIIRDEELNLIDTKEYTYSSNKSLPLTNNEDLLIGKLFNTYNFYIDGYIDELRISNIVRGFEPRLVIADIDEVNNYNIYPNPASSSIYIDIKHKANLKVLTITGKTVLEKMNFEGGNIDISRLSKGAYIVTLENDAKVLSKKLIIK
jgi:hypothetical protein